MSFILILKHLENEGLLDQAAYRNNLSGECSALDLKILEQFGYRVPDRSPRFTLVGSSSRFRRRGKDQAAALRQIRLQNAGQQIADFNLQNPVRVRRSGFLKWKFCAECSTEVFLAKRTSPCCQAPLITDYDRLINPTLLLLVGLSASLWIISDPLLRTRIFRFLEPVINWFFSLFSRH